MKYAVAYIDLNEGSDGLPKVHEELFCSVDVARGFIVQDIEGLKDFYEFADESDIKVNWKGLCCEVIMDDDNTCIHTIYNICEMKD